MTRTGAAQRRSCFPADLSPEALLLDALQPTVVERVELPLRKERMAALPKAFHDSPACSAFVRSFGSGRVWLHQAEALEHVAAGRDVLVTTGTGSGKSLVFQLALLREVAEGEGTALVFYPQKALCSDQLSRWRSMLAVAGLPEALVGEISGDTPMAERETIIASSRIVLATPDVAHAWLARVQSAPSVRDFLARTRFIVLDEAHALDGVFGSNCAYLFRRLALAIERVRGNGSPQLQYIAASATIGDAADHLAQLTGKVFQLVDEESNGAPGRGMTLLHLEGPERGAPAEAQLAEMLTALVDRIEEDAMVAFVDGRQAVERITKKLGDDRVLPYRSGYELADRHKIENALAEGSLRGCVATSALELGIDVAGFRIGFNLGVPATRKALRQRAGRVGRARPGVFAVIAPRNAFARLGTTLEEVATGPVESGHLYLQNSAVQFQQACCLRQETGGVTIEAEHWPAGFAEMNRRLMPGARLPRELERLAASVTNSPHHAFPLRQIADTRLVVRLANARSVEIGTITLEKALREAYPGATYLHFRKAYRVLDWRVSSFERSILVEPVAGGLRSSPMLSARVDISLDPESLLSAGVLVSERGSIAERCLRITETVHGFAIGAKKFPYATLSQSDRRLQSKYRQFESTGVVLRIAETWFAGRSVSKLEARKRVASALRAMLLAEQGILPSEVGQTHAGISFCSLMNSNGVDDAIVIFDDMQGGLRLTAPILSNFTGLLARLRKAAELAGEDSLLDLGTVARLEDWHASLQVTPDSPTLDLPRRVFAPGSELCSLRNGEVFTYTITGHQVMCIGGRDQLMYEYAVEGGGCAWVSQESVRPIGENWSYLPEDGLGTGQVSQ